MNSAMSGPRFHKPHCRYCGRLWYPKEFTRADDVYCDACHEDRLRDAQSVFGDAQIFENEAGRRYIGVQPPAFLPSLRWG